MAGTPLGWYKWFPRDFLASATVRKMSYTSQGIYRALLDLQWETGLPLTYPEATLVLRLSEFEKSEFEPFFDVCFPDGINAKLHEQRDKQTSALKAQSEGGKVGGQTAGRGRPKSPKGKGRGTPNKQKQKQKQNIVDKSTKWNDVWDAFVQHRIAMRKKMTPRAEELVLKKLEPYNEDQQIALLEESIEKGWQTVFPKDHSPKAKLSEPILGVDYLLDEKTGIRIPISEVQDED
jgi:hypothetical protein